MQLEALRKISTPTAGALTWPMWWMWLSEIMLPKLRRRRRLVVIGVADANTAAAQIKHRAANDGVVLAAVTQIHRVSAEAREDALLHLAISRVQRLESGRYFHRRLEIDIAAALQAPIRAGKS